ncbi:MAG: hypothetical protein J3K34DRAFT_526239 [Monoraphidium minutum]|nr:MAG: hypothetical protein J3K34DRAFT_526239 [Monoraphidium minutum]
MTVLLEKQLTKTDLGALSVASIRISLGKAKVRGALRSLLECVQRDDIISSGDQALEVLTTTTVPLPASDASGATWELLLKSTFRAGSQAFFIERAGEFLRKCDAQPGDVWQLTRHASKLGMRLIKAEGPGPEASLVKAEDGTDEACSSDVSDQQAIPACVRGPVGGGLLAPPPRTAPVAVPHAAAAAAAAAAQPRSLGAGSSPPGGLSEATHYGSTSSLASYQAHGALRMAPLPDHRGDLKRAAAPHDAPHGAKRAVPPGGPPSATPSPAGQQPAPGGAAPQPLALPAAAFHPGPGAAAGQLVQAPGVAGFYYVAPQPVAWQGTWAAAQQPFFYAAGGAAGGAAAPAAPPPALQLQLQAVQHPQHAQHILVTCNGLQGFLDLTDMYIVVAAGAGQHQGARVLPEVFEALAGKSSTRKWRRSLVVHPGGADPTITAPTTIGEWLARYPHLEARLPPRGSGRAAARAALGLACGEGGAHDQAAAPAAQGAVAEAAALQLPRQRSDPGAQLGGGSAPAAGRARAHSGDGATGRGSRAAAAAAAAPGHSLQQHAGHHSRAEPAKPRHASARPGRHDTGGAPGTPPAAAAPEAGGGGAVRWLPVQCIDLGGWLDLTDFMVLMFTAGGGEAVKLSPAEFEALAGKASTRKWRRSLVVHPGGDDARLREAVTIGEWMRRHNVQGALGPLPGSSPVPPGLGALAAGAMPLPQPAPAAVAAAGGQPQAQPLGSVYSLGGAAPFTGHGHHQQQLYAVQPQGYPGAAAAPAAPQLPAMQQPAAQLPQPLRPHPQHAPMQPPQQQPRQPPPQQQQQQQPQPPQQPAAAPRKRFRYFPSTMPHAAAAAPAASAARAPSPPLRSTTPQLPRGGGDAYGAAAARAAMSALASISPAPRADGGDEWYDDLLCDIGCGGGRGLGLATLSDLGVEGSALGLAGVPARTPTPASGAPPPGAGAAPRAAAGCGGGGGMEDEDDAAAALIVPHGAPGCAAAWMDGW